MIVVEGHTPYAAKGTQMSYVDRLIDLHDETTDDLTKRYLAQALRRQIAVITGAAKPSVARRLNFTERDLADDGQKIAAIKELRSRTGMSLLDSKNLVESYLAL